MRPIPVLLVTYNRLGYTKQALESICLSPGLPIELYVWDNGSTDGTAEWLSGQRQRQHRNTANFNVFFSERNVGLAPAMNWFFRMNSAWPFVAKVDNDTVLPDNWLADLHGVLTENAKFKRPRLGAVSGTCLRPPGLTAADWYGNMPNFPFQDGRLYINPACLGTGVLINMDMIRERGLLFEKFPRAPGAGPDDPCLISGWGAYIQEASAYSNWRFAMYSKVPVQLLNLKEDQVLSNDYPEYDAEIAEVRNQGNAWWESVGGIEGVRKYVQEHGGLEPLPGYKPIRDPVGYKRDNEPTVLLTGADDLEYRSTSEFWTERIAAYGTTRSTFLQTPQARINEFTAQHMQVLKRYAVGKDVLDVGCGWGRMSQSVAQLAKSYIGVDFMPALIDKARESLPDLDFRVASATALPFEDASFDLVIAVTCLSSFAAIFNQVQKELGRVVRPGSYIIYLEEDFVRVGWKLENL
jgi:glycosyltransferase involved in cell wall biosynthesis